MKKIRIGICSLAAALLMAFLINPAQADAASKKTVYVISSIKCKSASGKIVDTYSYKYNSKGLVKQKTMTTSGIKLQYKYTYDKDNQIKKAAVYSSGKPSYTEKYTYKDGLLSKGVFTSKYDGTKTISLYTYNAKKQLIYIDSDQNPDTTLKYNSKGSISTADFGFKTLKYKYNSKGFVSKEYMGKKLDRIYRYTYTSKNSARRKTMTCYYGNKKKICTYYFTYKKMKVNKAYVPAVKKQQIPYEQDPVFELFI